MLWEQQGFLLLSPCFGLLLPVFKQRCFLLFSQQWSCSDWCLHHWARISLLIASHFHMHTWEQFMGSWVWVWLQSESEVTCSSICGHIFRLERSMKISAYFSLPICMVATVLALPQMSHIMLSFFSQGDLTCVEFMLFGFSVIISLMRWRKLTLQLIWIFRVGLMLFWFSPKIFLNKQKMWGFTFRPAVRR